MQIKSLLHKLLKNIKMIQIEFDYNQHYTKIQANLKDKFKDVIDKYSVVGGVRIEDNILITDDGCVNLTQGLPRTVNEIQDTMKAPIK